MKSAPFFFIVPTAAEADQRHRAACMAMQRGGQERSRLGHDISIPQVRSTSFKIWLCMPLSITMIFYGVYILSFCFVSPTLLSISQRSNGTSRFDVATIWGWYSWGSAIGWDAGTKPRGIHLGLSTNNDRTLVQIRKRQPCRVTNLLYGRTAGRSS